MFFFFRKLLGGVAAPTVWVDENNIPWVDENTIEWRDN